MTYNQHAVRVVDGDETQGPSVPSQSIIDARQAALDAERGVEDETERGMYAAAAEAHLKRSQALADANIVAARAMVRGGQDPTAWPPAVALATENIATLLLGIQNAETVKIEPAFSAKSSAADIVKGAAVGRLLNGGGQ